MSHVILLGGNLFFYGYISFVFDTMNFIIIWYVKLLSGVFDDEIILAYYGSIVFREEEITYDVFNILDLRRKFSRLFNLF